MPGVVFTTNESRATAADVLLEVFERLHEADRHGVIEDALAEHEGVQVHVHVEIVEDGEDGDGVGGRDEGPEVEVVDEGDVTEVGDHAGVEECDKNKIEQNRGEIKL